MFNTFPGWNIDCDEGVWQQNASDYAGHKCAVIGMGGHLLQAILMLLWGLLALPLMELGVLNWILETVGTVELLMLP